MAQREQQKKIVVGACEVAALLLCSRMITSSGMTCLSHFNVHAMF